MLQYYNITISTMCTCNSFLNLHYTYKLHFDVYCSIFLIDVLQQYMSINVTIFNNVLYVLTFPAVQNIILIPVLLLAVLLIIAFIVIAIVITLLGEYTG